MRRALVFDTNAISHRGFLHEIRSFPGEKILPAVAYAELGVAFETRGRLARLKGALQQAGIEVEWFRASEAERAARSGALVGDFRKNARDHMIAAHLSPGRTLVTENLADYSFVDNKCTPAEALKQFS